MKKTMLTLIVAVASIFTAQTVLISPAQAHTKKTSAKKHHHKHMKKNADAGMTSRAA